LSAIEAPISRVRTYTSNGAPGERPNLADCYAEIMVPGRVIQLGGDVERPTMAALPCQLALREAGRPSRNRQVTLEIEPIADQTLFVCPSISPLRFGRN
jgi:hypothetical protein